MSDASKSLPELPSLLLYTACQALSLALAFTSALFLLTFINHTFLHNVPGAPSHPPWSLRVDFAIIALCLLLLCLSYLRSRFRPLPGPRAHPLIGNILHVFPRADHEKLTAHKHLYGEVVFYHGLGTRVVVLNSLQAVRELFEKSAQTYSDRPYMTFAAELLGLRDSIVFLGIGPELREQRRLMHRMLGMEAVRRYHGVQEDLAALFGKRLLDSPASFFEEARLTTAKLILSTTYGISVSDPQDEYVRLAEGAMRVINAAIVPGKYLCDIFPLLKHLPSVFPFQRQAKKGRVAIQEFLTRPLEHVKQEMLNGSAAPSLTRALLSETDGLSAANEERTKWVTGALYGAGGETSFTALLVLLLAMALYPDAQIRAQAELDATLGPTILPTLADRPSLPYLAAVLKETLRWHPVLPLGVARAAAADGEVRGFRVPRGAIIFPNVWAISRDAAGAYDPEAFVPERFLGADPAPDPALYAFGFARRACPGRHLADNALFILAATVLSAFDVRAPEGGLEVEFNKETIVSYPLPFGLSITPRSQAKAALIEERASRCTS